MKPEELAAKLNGRQMGEEITDEEADEAKRAGLVVLFGYSDDNAEFRGAINDEVGCYAGGEVVILDQEIFDFEVCGERCRYADEKNAEARKHGSKIAALWCKEANPHGWSYATEMPHATFDVFEDAELFCRGIVFALKDAR